MLHTRGAILGTILACVLPLAACGDDELPDYTKENVCGISADAVAAVLGTRGFEVTYDQRPTMPFDGDPSTTDLEANAGKTSCTVSTEDSRLVLQGELIGPGEAESLQASARTLGNVFRHAGGLGGVRGGSSIWACGQVKLTAVARDVDPSAGSLQKVLEEFADLAGCWPS